MNLELGETHFERIIREKGLEFRAGKLYPIGAKKCSKCQRILSRDKFYKTSGRYELSSRCKSCISACNVINNANIKALAGGGARIRAKYQPNKGGLYMRKWRQLNRGKLITIARKNRDVLSNSYIASLLNISILKIPSKIIAAKRDQVKLIRTIREFKKELKNG